MSKHYISNTVKKEPDQNKIMLNGKTLNFKSPSKSEIKPQRRFGAMQRPKVNITIKGIHESIQNTVPSP
jgi:hypothetical protein